MVQKEIKEFINIKIKLLLIKMNDEKISNFIKINIFLANIL